jgi:hypothetical protein
MLISPRPKLLYSCKEMCDNIKMLALHPKFFQSGNSFVVILDSNKQINVCKATFIPVKKGDPRAKLKLIRPIAGKNKLEVVANSENGLQTCYLSKDENGLPIIKKLDFPRS